MILQQPQKPELISKRKGEEDEEEEPAIKKRKGGYSGVQTQDAGQEQDKILQMMDEVPEVI